MASPDEQRPDVIQGLGLRQLVERLVGDLDVAMGDVGDELPRFRVPQPADDAPRTCGIEEVLAE
ncbi:MAG: hypothetical protein DI534_01445 [Leifsonia xyli]|nr:MAG: hypothetical protein DI534_01445 [Leifsonia xyli]